MKETSGFRGERHRLGIFANGIRPQCCNFHKRFQFAVRGEPLVLLSEDDLLEWWLEPLFVEQHGAWFAVRAVEWLGWAFALVERLVHAWERGKVHSFSLQLLL